jgi:hypothetical protein
MSSKQQQQESIIPKNRPIHSVLGDGIRTLYYSSLNLQRSSQQTQTYEWNVHLGDVVAVSTTTGGSTTTVNLDEWEPHHLQKSSSHWKVGLVVALTQELSPKEGTKFRCTVQWLQKALDTPFAKELSGTYRPFRKNKPRCRLPFVLLRTNERETIDPSQLLPARISMITEHQLMKATKDGIEYDEDHNNKWSFEFHCPKRIENGKMSTEEQPDEWVALNPSSAKVKGSSSKVVTPPKPMRQAWESWDVCQQNPELFAHLIRGFQQAMQEKHKEYIDEKNRQVEEEKRRRQAEEEEEEAERLEVEATHKNSSSNNNNNNNNKRKPSEREESSQKRVRIQEPHEATTETKPVSSSSNKKKKKPSLASIVKPKTTKKATSAGKAMTQLKTKSSKAKAKTPPTNTPKSNHKRGETKPSTVDTNSTPPKRGRPRSRPRQQHQQTLEVTPITDIVHSGKHERGGTPCDFYERVTMAIDTGIFQKPKNRTTTPSIIDASSFEIAVGNLVVICNNEAQTPECNPFQVPWGVAQVVSIYQTKETREWSMEVRWFYRYAETDEAVQERLNRRTFSKEHGLLETTQVSHSPIEAALPAHVYLTSEKDFLEQFPDANNYQEEVGLPIFQFQCQYWLKDDDEIVMVKDWTEYHNNLLSSLSIPRPLWRGLFQCKGGITKRLAEKYKDAIRARREAPESKFLDPPSLPESSSETSASSEPEPEPNSFSVAPLTTAPMYERWGNKFYEGIRLDIEQKSLRKDFTPRTKQWTLKVGYVVPIRCDQDKLAYFHCDQRKCWYPFRDRWSPGQVVSIYQTEVGDWMMQVRWFNRFRDMIDQQQKGLELFDKPHVVFETEAYMHLSVTSCFPGRVVITSHNTDDWEIATSVLTGLPLIPRLCHHICLDDEVDDALDWTNYDVTMNFLPRPLIRGLLLDPRNRANKEWILMLSRYYKKFIKIRGSDLDEEVIRKWSGEGQPSMKIEIILFDPQEVNVMFGYHLHSAKSSDLARREFSRSLKVTVPVKYIAAPSKITRRMKKHAYSCSVGDIVCFYSDDAKPQSDHILMKNVKHPWFPFSVAWSFGQVLSIYRDIADGSSDSPMIEIRRFYRASELPEVVQDFMPLSNDAEREDVFESDHVIEGIPASHLLGTADLYLGHHVKTANQHKTDSGTLVSGRCSSFFLTAHQRFQPLFSSGFSPEIWFDRLQERGMILSIMRQNFEGLDQAMSSTKKGAKLLDVCGLLSNRDSKERRVVGSAIVVSGGTFKSKDSQRRFYKDVSLSPQWSEFESHALLYNRKDRDQEWEVNVGDFVAVRHPDIPNDSSSSYPFCGHWVPCQVLAIFSDGFRGSDGMVTREDISFEVRFLRITNPPAVESGLSEICECIPSKVSCLKAMELVGPIVLYRRDVRSELDWEKFPKYLPCAAYWASESLDRDISNVVEFSRAYSNEDPTKILLALGVKQKSESADLQGGKKTASSDEGNRGSKKPGDVWSTAEPFHVDISRLRMYYSEIFLVPSHHSSVDEGEEAYGPPWKVQMGDVVLVHCDGAKRYPLECNWGGKI